MSKRLITFFTGLVTLLILSLTAAAAEPDFSFVKGRITFRGYEWGTTYEEVLKKETAGMEEGTDYETRPSEDEQFDSVLYIRNTYNGKYPVHIQFCFADGRLAAGGYLLNEENGSYETYYNTFVEISEQFRNHFGAPQMEYQNWTGFDTEDSVEHPWEGLEQGVLWLYVGWWNEDLERATIEIGSSDYPQTMIRFYAPGFE